MDTAIIAAAGESGRMGGKTSKLFIEICGKPVLLWSLEPALRIKSIGRIVIAIRSADVAKCRKMLSRVKGPEIEIIAGGVTRAETIKLALKAAEPAEPGLIVIHDGARPCASVELWKRVMAAAKTNGAAVPALPITDTIKTLNDDGSVENTCGWDSRASRPRRHSRTEYSKIHLKRLGRKSPMPPTTHPSLKWPATASSQFPANPGTSN
jgi:2-C-methyl-D-erythritol 4-phosphate cytidylyltransferase